MSDTATVTQELANERIELLDQLSERWMANRRRLSEVRPGEIAAIFTEMDAIKIECGELMDAIGEKYVAFVRTGIACNRVRVGNIDSVGIGRIRIVPQRQPIFTEEDHASAIKT